MTPSPHPPEGAQEDVAKRIENLEIRLDALERRLGMDSRGAHQQGVSGPPPEAVEAAALGDVASIAGLAGQSLLGLAAAYLLRAMAQSGRLPPEAGVALGLLYALGWLAWAARAPSAGVWKLVTRALTSALILGPLLWEAHLKFQATTSWQTAAVLVLFSTSALGISWRKNQAAVALIGTLVGLLLSAAFLIRTHDLLPYTAGLLALALAVEASACLDHYLGERWVVAGIADLAVLLVTYIAARPGGAPEGYPAMSRGAVFATQITLVTIYLGSTIVRTLARGIRITAFEVVQASLALTIGIWGALAAAYGDSRVVLWAGLFSTGCGLLCYLVSLAFLERRAGNDRNFYSYSTFGLGLTLAGSFLLLGGWLRLAVWTLAAMGFVLFGKGSGRVILKLHAGAFAALGLLSSGLAFRANASYLGTVPHAAESLRAEHWIAAVGAVLCYAFVLRSQPPESCQGVFKMASLLLGASAVWGLAGLASAVAAPLCLASQGKGDGDFCPTALTASLVALAACAAFCFKRWRRFELKILTWLLLTVAAYKFLIQDLRQTQAFGFVLSLLAFGGGLIWLPTVLRHKERSAAE